MSARPNRNKAQPVNLAKVAAAMLLGSAQAQVPGAAEVPLVVQAVAAAESAGLLYYRTYQREVVTDFTTPIMILEWSRQVGKSHAMAGWCGNRILSRLATPGVLEHTIVVISNSRSNGAEFALKAAAVLGAIRQGVELESAEHTLDEGTAREFEVEAEDFTCLLRVRFSGEEDGRSITKTARILVLAASERTARGFSGDLILDEFAFHQNARKMWAAAEPIVSSQTLYLCRIASTHNGKGSLFNRWIVNGTFPVHSVTRTRAWLEAKDDPIAPLLIKSLRSKTLKLITPQEAEEEADNRADYRQNYENDPNSEGGQLLTEELIVRARGLAAAFVKDDQAWSAGTLARLRKLADARAQLYVGADLGRVRDSTLVSVFSLEGLNRVQVAVLKMRGPLDRQREEFQRLMDLGSVIARLNLDMTGIGAQMYDELYRQYGSRVMGTNFSTTVPLRVEEMVERKGGAHTMKVTERMALDLLTSFQSGRIWLPAGHSEQERSLLIPERVVTSSGAVQVAAERGKDDEGRPDHAEYFWALALAEAAVRNGGAGALSREIVNGMDVGRASFAVPRVDWLGGGGMTGPRGRRFD